MAQSIISLGGYVFPYNPYPNANPPIKSTSYNPTVDGGYRITWVNSASPNGTFVQDQDIKLSWKFLDKSFYDSLASLFQQVGTLVYIDEYTIQWTVKFNDLSYKSRLAGGDDALEDVEVILGVVSKP